MTEKFIFHVIKNIDRSYNNFNAYSKSLEVDVLLAFPPIIKIKCHFPFNTPLCINVYK